MSLFLSEAIENRILPEDVFREDGKTRFRVRGTCDSAAMALVDALGLAEGFEAFATFRRSGVKRSRSTRKFKKM